MIKGTIGGAVDSAAAGIKVGDAVEERGYWRSFWRENQFNSMFKK
ncbi:hypothetical protein [Lysinibacillus sp. 3P01SB]